MQHYYSVRGDLLGRGLRGSPSVGDVHRPALRVVVPEDPVRAVEGEGPRVGTTLSRGVGVSNVGRSVARFRVFRVSMFHIFKDSMLNVFDIFLRKR